MDNTLKAVLEFSEPITRDLWDQAYEQGLDHAIKVAKIISARQHKTIEAFLLDLSTELNKLKKH